MYRKLKEELTQENLVLLDRLKSMGVDKWPGTDRPVDEVIIEIENKSQNILKQKFGYDSNNKPPSKSYYFITLGQQGEPSVLKDLYNRVQEALHRYKWFRKSIISYEYYTQKGQHPHFHAVVDTDKRRDTIIKLFSTFFKVSPNYVDVKKYYGDPQGHIKYVKGIKDDKNKQEYIDKDNALKDELNIPYFTDNWE